MFKTKNSSKCVILCNFHTKSTIIMSLILFNNIIMLLLINNENFFPLMRLLVLHGFADGFVVWLIRGEVKLHAGVETSIR